MGTTLLLDEPPARPSPQQPTTHPADGAYKPAHARPSATVAARLNNRPAPQATATKIVMPVRYAAWLAGDMGRILMRRVEGQLEAFEGVRISRLPSAMLIEAQEEPGPFLEAVLRAAYDMEAMVETHYPVFHHQMGPVWTGTLQSVFS